MKKVVVGLVAVAIISTLALIMLAPGQEAGNHAQRGQPAEHVSGAREAQGALETVRGEIVELPEGGRGAGDSKGLDAEGPPGPLITIRSATETIRVHAGPPRYHNEIGLVLAEKQIIEVTGTRQGRQPVLVAQTIKQGDRVFRIRGDNGEKLWRPNQKKAELVLSTISGEVVDLAPELAEQVPGRERSGMMIALQTDAGKMVVQLGPESFRTAHGLSLAVGDRLDVSGWALPGATVVGNPIMLAGTIRKKGNQELRIRDEQRRALWTTN